MKKRRIKTWPVIILIVVIVFMLCIINIFSSLKGKSENSIKVVESIEKYGYNLNKNETSYYKDLFKQLKNELLKEDTNEEEYVSIISKMFLADFYSLDNAINKNDVGGIEFVYKDYKDSFIKSAKDTMYAYVENNSYGNRKQELPIVKEVKITDIKNDNYSGDKTSDENAFYVNLEIQYKKDLDYQTKVELVLIHSNNKLEIVSMK